MMPITYERDDERCRIQVRLSPLRLRAPKSIPATAA